MTLLPFLQLQLSNSLLLIAYVGYEVCLKSNGTVHAAQATFIAVKKALLSMMSQCLMVSKIKFQHSVTTTFLFARFSVKELLRYRFVKI